MRDLQAMVEQRDVLLAKQRNAAAAGTKDDSVATALQGLAASVDSLVSMSRLAFTGDSHHFAAASSAPSTFPVTYVAVALAVVCSTLISCCLVDTTCVLSGRTGRTTPRTLV